MSICEPNETSPCAMGYSECRWSNEKEFFENFLSIKEKP